MEDQILEFLRRPGYLPVKPATLAKQLKVSKDQFPEFDAALERLQSTGRLRISKRGEIRPLATSNMLVGTIRRRGGGGGTFYPHEPPRGITETGVSVSPRDMHGAYSGDEVVVRLLPRRGAGGQRFGRVEEILQRATNQFVGTYFVRDHQSFVRIDGTAFQEPIPVGDPGAKGAQPDDKVVVEMLRFPTNFLPGEAVLTQVLGPHGEPGVDTLSIIHEFGLPHEFSEDVLNDSREAVANFDPDDLTDRTDLSKETIITIDPVDARDFDDAISLRRSRNGHWHLGVHIADVSTFVTPGSPLDEEARNRGTSVYLPNRVIPMIPELISNGLASLQKGKVRYTKSVFIEFTAEGVPVHTEFANSAIKVAHRFAYEDVMPIIRNPDKQADGVSAKVRALVLRMYELAMILRKRRFEAGALNLDLPEVKLNFDPDGRVIGAHETVNDESHQMIEEFMLAANVAVATELEDRGLPFLRRVHGDPNERKLRAFAEFVEALGFPLKRYQSRAELQELIAKVRGKPQEHAVNYALLRSLKQAEYAAVDLGHYALAVDDYCHFTSPIRRYPDLTVHRLFDGLVRGVKRPKESDPTNVDRLAKHCSFTERRAAGAERELTRVKLLMFLQDKVGEQFEAVITGVESYGLFCRGIEIPAEGLIHIASLDQNEYFDHDRGTMTLTGRRRGKTYRLGDRIKVEVFRVDVDRRELDLRIATGDDKAKSKKRNGKSAKPAGNRKPKAAQTPPKNARGGKKKPQQGGKRPRRKGR